MNHWGRIFFTYDDQKNLIQVKGQPLRNHVGNCREILRQFRSSYFHEATKERLLAAVELHDDGKKETFRILEQKDDQSSKGKSGRKSSKKKAGKKEKNGFSYSFAGHRFRVPGQDVYIDALIRSHHEFSVEQINREKAKFSEKQDKKHFADDLYLLCMADHLEAELAVKTVENKKGDIPRTFMEFVTQRVENQDHTFTVVPWPFEPDSFTLRFELRVPEVENISRKSAKEIQEIFERGTVFREETIEIMLRRD